ncbi:nucleotidyltransferase family protein [Paenibacillus humicola]|uniref:nucleotidyltransferase domain-containing protein n=1 Tax=Paenibacillus humicola TaxID=3110540 RepID=UPI00237BA37F|nr:nucleotidyltransferase family protein [Paenibacillus humicola]
MEDRLTLDQDAFSIEMQLLLVILRTENMEYVAENEQHLLSETNWKTFIDLARHHRVEPYLHYKLKQLTATGIPSFVKRTFNRDYRVNTFLMLQLCGEIERIGKLFAEHDIRALNLKGPVIAKDLYGDVSLRTSCDLDLVIPISDLQRAEALLAAEGYVKDDYIHTLLNDWKWRHHHTTFSHPQKRIKIELHWRLNPAPSKNPGFDALWERRRTSPSIGRHVYYLGKEDLFLFLVSHGARHGWSRLRWLLDIRQLLQQQPDPDKLVRLLHDNLCLRSGGQAIVLASELLDAEAGPELGKLAGSGRSRRLARDTLFYLERMVNLHTPPVPVEVERHHKRYLFDLLTPRQKLLFIASFLFPYPEDADTLPLPKPLHFLYVPLRPFLWAWRKLAGA